MAAGLDSIGFGVLGVPLPPDTTELERQAGVLESAVGSRRSLGDDGDRAYRLGERNAGIANDAQRHLNEGLRLARTHKMDAPDLHKLQNEVAELAFRRSELIDRAWTTRMDINGPFKIQDVYPV
ncbi:hypothetical protein [Streptosporangium roseum]|uniref:hypothetical protein n=1 Tax=Streptosporangium roseum TaxID=2001 RepID=UPI003321FD89